MNCFYITYEGGTVRGGEEWSGGHTSEMPQRNEGGGGEYFRIRSA